MLFVARIEKFLMCINQITFKYTSYIEGLEADLVD